jgi:hypothetical protein
MKAYLRFWGIPTHNPKLGTTQSSVIRFISHRVTPSEGPLGTDHIGTSMDTTIVLDILEKKEYLLFLRGIEPPIIISSLLIASLKICRLYENLEVREKVLLLNGRKILK